MTCEILLFFEFLFLILEGEGGPLETGDFGLFAKFFDNF